MHRSFGKQPNFNHSTAATNLQPQHDYDRQGHLGQASYQHLLSMCCLPTRTSAVQCGVMTETATSRDSMNPCTTSTINHHGRTPQSVARGRSKRSRSSAFMSAPSVPLSNPPSGNKSTDGNSQRTHQDKKLAGDEHLEVEVDDELRNVVLNRARVASVKVKLIRKPNLVCHICHNRKDSTFQFGCGKATHVYCLPHCEKHNILPPEEGIVCERCPICCLECCCSKCQRKLDNVARLYKTASLQQGTTYAETKFDNILHQCEKASDCGRRNVQIVRSVRKGVFITPDRPPKQNLSAQSSRPPQPNRKVATIPRRFPTSTPSRDIFNLGANGNNRVIATIQRISSGCWTARRMLRCGENEKECTPIMLHRGGCLKVFPNLISREQCLQVKCELIQSNLFRRYKIQGQDEPRAHFLLHEDADEDFDSKPQPGYTYARNVTLKSRPLKRLQRLKALSDNVKTHCKVDKWTIGVNPVIYRDGNDRMGDHADNDQGEEIILAVVVDAPESVDKLRRVRIKPFKKLSAEEDDEDIELFLRPGDAYEMNGEMQRYYSHSVPPEKKPKPFNVKSTECCVENEQLDAPNDTRIVVVFRTGKCVKVHKDTGRPCEDLSPQPKPTVSFGNPGALQEGHLYPRAELYKTGGHLGQQRGLSGNKDEGCDAIIVSGLREDGLGVDNWISLMYAVESYKGAEGIVTSHRKKNPIRIFRSTAYDSKYGAIYPNEDDLKNRQFYRYDGLYVVQGFTRPERMGPYRFHLKRGNHDLNSVSNDKYYDHCIRLGTIHGDNYRRTFRQKRTARERDSVREAARSIMQIANHSNPKPHMHSVKAIGVNEKHAADSLLEFGKSTRMYPLDSSPFSLRKRKTPFRENSPNGSQRIASMEIPLNVGRITPEDDIFADSKKVKFSTTIMAGRTIEDNSPAKKQCLPVHESDEVPYLKYFFPGPAVDVHTYTMNPGEDKKKQCIDPDERARVKKTDLGKKAGRLTRRSQSAAKLGFQDLDSVKPKARKKATHHKYLSFNPRRRPMKPPANRNKSESSIAGFHQYMRNNKYRDFDMEAACVLFEFRHLTNLAQGLPQTTDNRKPLTWLKLSKEAVVGPKTNLSADHDLSDISLENRSFQQILGAYNFDWDVVFNMATQEQISNLKNRLKTQYRSNQLDEVWRWLAFEREPSLDSSGELGCIYDHFNDKRKFESLGLAKQAELIQRKWFRLRSQRKKEPTAMNEAHANNAEGTNLAMQITENESIVAASTASRIGTLQNHMLPSVATNPTDQVGYENDWTKLAFDETTQYEIAQLKNKLRKFKSCVFDRSSLLDTVLRWLVFEGESSLDPSGELGQIFNDLVEDGRLEGRSLVNQAKSIERIWSKQFPKKKRPPREDVRNRESKFNERMNVLADVEENKNVAAEIAEPNMVAAAASAESEEIYEQVLKWLITKDLPLSSEVDFDLKKIDCMVTAGDHQSLNDRAKELMACYDLIRNIEIEDGVLPPSESHMESLSKPMDPPSSIEDAEAASKSLADALDQLPSLPPFFVGDIAIHESNESFNFTQVNEESTEIEDVHSQHQQNDTSEEEEAASTTDLTEWIDETKSEWKKNNPCTGAKGQVLKSGHHNNGKCKDFCKCCRICDPPPWCQSGGAHGIMSGKNMFSSRCLPNPPMKAERKRSNTSPGQISRAMISRKRNTALQANDKQPSVVAKIESSRSSTTPRRSSRERISPRRYTIGLQAHDKQPSVLAKIDSSSSSSTTPRRSRRERISLDRYNTGLQADDKQPSVAVKMESKNSIKGSHQCFRTRSSSLSLARMVEKTRTTSTVSRFKVGFRFKIFFSKMGWYVGTVDKVRPIERGGENFCYSVTYDDGNVADLTYEELNAVVAQSQIPVGDVGFMFCKKIHGGGVLDGEVVEKLPDGKRRCHYAEDSTNEVYSLKELEKFSKQSHSKRQKWPSPERRNMKTKASNEAKKNGSTRRLRPR